MSLVIVVSSVSIVSIEYVVSAVLVMSVVSVVNPRRACAARVTVVGSVCLSVCPLLSICLHE